MKVRCNGNMYVIEGSIVLEMLRNISEEVIEISDKFEDVLIKMRDNYKPETKKDEIKYEIEKYEFYDFFEIDEDIGDKIIPKILEDDGIYDISVLIIKYPILSKYPKYIKDFDIETLDTIKYVTPHFHENVKAYSKEEYIRHGNVEMFKYLIGGNYVASDIELIVEYKKVEMISAYENSNIGLVRNMMSHLMVYKWGCDIIFDIDISKNVSDYFCAVASYGSIKHLKYFMEFVFDIDNCLGDAINNSVITGNLEYMKLLYGLDLSPTFTYYRYPLNCAAKYNKFDIIKYLMENKEMSINEIRGAINTAKFEKHIEIYEYLKGKINMQDDEFISEIYDNIEVFD